MCPAIHINSRSWLRSSSTHEPSDPPPKVVFFRFKAVARPAPPTQEACEVEPVASNPKMKRLRIEKQTKKARGRHPSTRPTGLFKPSPTDGRPLLKRKRELPSPHPLTQKERERERAGRRFRRLPLPKLPTALLPSRDKRARHPEQARYPTVTVFRVAGRPQKRKPGQTLRTSTLPKPSSFTHDCRVTTRSNDPSAGSPTETLLRLLLPLNDQVRASSRPTAPPVKGGPRPIRGPH